MKVTTFNTPESKRMYVSAAFLLMTALVGVALAGCTKQSESTVDLPASSKGQQDTTPDKTPPPPPPSPVIGQQESLSAATSVMEPAMIAWRQGDKSTAISRFVEANWSARPLFAPGSTLSLSESQFTLLSTTDRKTKLTDAINQISNLKQLTRAVAQAGRDAAVQNDSAQARKYFTSLKQCGEALEGPESMLIVNQHGKALKKMADEELAKLGQ